MVPYLRASNEGLPRPRVNGLDTPPFCSIVSCSLHQFSLRESPGSPSLRASDEHILIVRVLRARRIAGRLPHFLPSCFFFDPFVILPRHEYSESRW